MFLLRLKLFCISLCMALLAGCYVNLSGPAPALAVKMEAETANKLGTSTCYHVLWVFAHGNCSLHEAMVNGDITKVHHVDGSAKVILYGAYSEVSVNVYGE